MNIKMLQGFAYFCENKPFFRVYVGISNSPREHLERWSILLYIIQIQKKNDIRCGCGFYSQLSELFGNLIKIILVKNHSSGRSNVLRRMWFNWKIMFFLYEWLSRAHAKTFPLITEYCWANVWNFLSKFFFQLGSANVEPTWKHTIAMLLCSQQSKMFKWSVMQQSPRAEEFSRWIIGLKRLIRRQSCACFEQCAGIWHTQQN